MRECRVVGIGEILWDVFEDRRVLGGAPANFSYHAMQLGAQGIAIGRVGVDAAGDAIVRGLAEKGLSSYLQRDPEHPTGRVDIRRRRDGGHEFSIQDESAWDYLRWCPEIEELVASADILCYGSLAQRNPVATATIQRCLARTSGSCRRIFDVNLRQSWYSKQVLEQTLKLSHVLKLNDDELEIFQAFFSLPRQESLAIQSLIRSFELDLVVLTRGDKGSRLVLATGEESQLAISSVDVVDTVGAGDAFTAAVAVGLHCGLSLRDTHSLAARLATFVCGREGATPAYESADFNLARCMRSL